MSEEIKVPQEIMDILEGRMKAAVFHDFCEATVLVSLYQEVQDNCEYMSEYAVDWVDNHIVELAQAVRVTLHKAKTQGVS